MIDNQHFDRAKSRLHNGTTNEVARAQAEATMALAHEQRTANLIEYLFHAEGDEYEPLHKLIKERLGIE